MSTTLEKTDNKTASSQVGLPGNASQITHPKPGDIVNPELQRIADDVLSAVRLSFATVIAKSDKAPGGVSADKSSSGGIAEASLAKVINQFPLEKRATAQKNAQALISSNQASRGAALGRFSNINVDTALNGGFQQLLKQSEPIAIDLTKIGFTVARIQTPTTDLKPFINPARFAELWGGPTRNVSNNISVAKSTPPNTGKLQLILTSLRCIDETNPEWPSEDEMAVGGVTISEKGVTTKVNETPAGSKYSDGVEQQLNYVFGEFSLTESSFWPKRFGAQLIIAEKDFGLFSSFLQTMWDEIGKAVLEELDKAAKAAGVALAIFLQMPQFGPLIGLAISAAAQWIVENLWKWLIDVFKDDIFTPAMVWVELQDMSSRWLGGSTSSPVMSQNYRGFQGEYQLNYRWQLADMPPVGVPDPKKHYKIMAKHSGMCLNVAGGSQESGPVIQWPFAGGQGNELWRFESDGNGYYKIVAKHSGKCLDIVGASKEDWAPLHQHTSWGGDNQKFRLEHIRDGFYKIEAKHSGKCLNVPGASKTSVPIIQCSFFGGQDNELWQYIEVLPIGPPIGSTVALRAFTSNSYVAAHDFGNSPLIANRVSVGPWEKFMVVDAGNGEVALKATINGKYVAAHDAGNSPLIANRDTIGPWERFRWVNLTTGRIALQAIVNNRYVTNPLGGGTSPLIANQEAIGLWETFVFELL